MEFAKGHGTENDFVVLPDPDGALDLSPRLVAAICDRRAGVGADGVLHVVRATDGDAEWFMDYRNADGSLAEMCGNGIRVMARWLADHGGLADPAAPLHIGTRGGLRIVQVLDADAVRVEMGPVAVKDGDLLVRTPGGAWPATAAYAPNPHAVAFVEDLAAVGSLASAPAVTPDGAFPEGVNVELVVPRGPRHVAMRVHERGSGETRSCGTGVCAVAAVAAAREGCGSGSTWTVDVPGGRLTVDLDSSGNAALTGPAVIVASGRLAGDWVSAHR